MPELYSPKEVAALLRMTSDALRKKIAAPHPCVTIDEKRIHLEVRRIEGRIYFTEGTYKSLVDALARS